MTQGAKDWTALALVVFIISALGFVAGWISRGSL
jgi:hypothetical protein